MTTNYTLLIPDAMVNRMRVMHPQLKRKIRAALDEIIHNSVCGKQLKLELVGLRSYKVGRFKIIYRSTPDKTIDLVAAGPSKTIYEETYRLISG